MATGRGAGAVEQAATTATARMLTALEQQRTIGQFIWLVVTGRIMAGHQFTYGRDAGYSAALPIPGTERALHRTTGFGPLVGANEAIEASVSDNFDRSIRPQHVYEDAIIMGGIPNPLGRKDFDGAIPGGSPGQQRRNPQIRLYDETYFTTVLRLGTADRRLDGI
jgi:hypothetical protein